VTWRIVHKGERHRTSRAVPRALDVASVVYYRLSQNDAHPIEAAVSANELVLLSVLYRTTIHREMHTRDSFRRDND
jgi:hypothetical protein